MRANWQLNDERLKSAMPVVERKRLEAPEPAVHSDSVATRASEPRVKMDPPVLEVTLLANSGVGTVDLA